MGAFHEQPAFVGSRNNNNNNKQQQIVKASLDSRRNNGSPVISSLKQQDEPIFEAIRRAQPHQLSPSNTSETKPPKGASKMTTSPANVREKNKLDFALRLSPQNQTHKDDGRKNGNNPVAQQRIKPTRKRYLILLMYVMLQLIKSFQWICLASITNVVAKFYQVDNLAVNWTTILFMFTFLTFGVPATWLMEALGLRRSVLIGSLGVTTGLLIKVFSCNRDGFWIGMFGHLIVGLSEPFFFSSYSQLSSIWFPDDQVASATSFAIIGEQIGLALGFIVPPLLVGSDPDNIETVQRGLYYMFLGNAVISTVNTASIYLLFDNEPKFAPGIARYKQILKRQASEEEKMSLFQSVKQQVRTLKSLLTDKNFIILLVGFGINEGSAYSIHTLLNQMIIGPDELASNTTTTLSDTPSGKTNNWDLEDPSLVVGNSGLILITAGLFGSFFCGSLLDRYHRYKLTASLIYSMALVSMIATAFCVTLGNSLILYLVIIPLGFSLTGYASCGFDYGVEITYPTPELLSATVLNVSAQVFGIPISLVGSYIVDWYGSEALGIFFSLVLLAGFVVCCLQGGELKRQTAVNENDKVSLFCPSSLCTANNVAVPD